MVDAIQRCQSKDRLLNNERGVNSPLDPLIGVAPRQGIIQYWLLGGGLKALKSG